MKQEEYLAAIKKQQSLIRKLFANRKRRSEVIDELTKQRYDHLRGKFFKTPKDDDRFKAVDGGTTLYICDIYAESNYINSEQVNVNIECRCIVKLYKGYGKDQILDEITFYNKSFRFALEDDIDEILAPLYITKNQAIDELNAIYDEFVKNYLKKG